MAPQLFRDRTEAGQKLGEAMRKLRDEHPDMDDPVVLALPRGGVPVALEVARMMEAPLDLLMVRKLGVPFQPELAAGAVVNGDDPQVVINDEVMRMADLTEEDLEPIKERELAKIDERRQRYLQGRSPLAIAGRDAIVIDDGVATGATTRAALKALRQKNPRSLTLAIPVAPPDTVEKLKQEVDHVVCLEAPEWFRAIGLHYANFDQVTDDEVVQMLDDAADLARLKGRQRES
ncbi:MAG TPA: phosphoribosyltransferase [Alphaproteobacteria bacterium]|nr:phosphoribosyltransferase [Alphaproteobacteria bacterium]